MLEDTQDSGSFPYKEAILGLLWMADGRMLHDSGNPVYLRLREELDRLRWVAQYVSLRICIYDPVPDQQSRKTIRKAMASGTRKAHLVAQSLVFVSDPEA
jgi:hypothetical protein